MDVALTPRLAYSGTVPVPRTDIVANREAVAVDLPPEQTVQSAPAGEALKLDIRGRDLQERAEAERQRNEALRRDTEVEPEIERRLVVEPRTRTVILQKSDPTTGEVIETVPDEATLRQRIYARALAEQARDAEAGASIELKA